jgi:sulfhydrogenase subunit gamma (sulfur reductase)
MRSAQTEPAADPHLPHEAEVIERIDESATVFTLRLRFTDPDIRSRYRFAPGQFNMLYPFGVGEVAISIVSDPAGGDMLDHTIRRVGRVTTTLAALATGDRIGLRGPYGRGWPMDELRGRDVVVITGGLGCAPSVSVVHYIVNRRSNYGRMTIVQGVKHHQDLLWREQYAAWARLPDTEVLLSADTGGPLWPGHVGPVTALFDRIPLTPGRSAVLLCGPEGMMHAAIRQLNTRAIADTDIWLSMERNMQCAVRQCGHCQLGPKFICRDGPVFRYDEVRSLLGVKAL